MARRARRCAAPRRRHVGRVRGGWVRAPPRAPRRRQAGRGMPGGPLAAGRASVQCFGAGARGSLGAAAGSRAALRWSRGVCVCGGGSDAPRVRGVPAWRACLLPPRVPGVRGGKQLFPLLRQPWPRPLAPWPRPLTPRVRVTNLCAARARGTERRAARARGSKGDSLALALPCCVYTHTHPRRPLPFPCAARRAMSASSRT